MNEWHNLEARYDGRDTTIKVDGKEVAGTTTIAGMQVISSASEDFNKPVEEALMELRDNFNFSDFHEERVRTLLENDESLIDDLNHLVIAASVMLSDAAEMKSGGLKSYEMGDQIIIEEKQDEEWQVVRTLGVQVAQILAHARAKKRVEQLEDLVGGLGEDPMDKLDEIDKPDPSPLDWPFDDGGGGVDPIDPNPAPYDPNPNPKPWDTHWVGGNGTWYTTSADDVDEDSLESLLNKDIKEIEGEAKIRDL